MPSAPPLASAFLLCFFFSSPSTSTPLLLSQQSDPLPLSMLPRLSFSQLVSCPSRSLARSPFPLPLSLRLSLSHFLTHDPHMRLSFCGVHGRVGLPLLRRPCATRTFVRPSPFLFPLQSPPPPPFFLFSVFFISKFSVIYVTLFQSSATKRRDRRRQGRHCKK